MNRQNGIASLTLVLLLLVLGTLILTGLNQQLITFTMLVGDESRAIQQQAAAQSALEWGAFSTGRCSLMYSANRDKRNVFVCVY
ncbi:protein YgdB [Enterobacter cloacae]|uniref:Protein YgdB n=1 Tax=Enterobacter cloacae TaxID=550 RepID=A0A377LW53_ENTCL|nr:protein YgdB [Enterobacter cloacae]